MLVIIQDIISSYTGMVASLPEDMQIIPPVFLYALLIAAYSLFIWFFYRFLARRDIVKIDLAKYNTSSFPLVAKIVATFFYIIKFVVVLPITVIFWFVVFSVLLIVLAKEQTTSAVLIIGASVVTSIRLTSYFTEDLSKDLAKMIPFTLLGVAIVTPGFFDIPTTIARISEIPALFSSIFYYAAFIMGLEMILRFLYIEFHFIGSWFKKSEEGNN